MLHLFRRADPLVLYFVGTFLVSWSFGFGAILIFEQSDLLRRFVMQFVVLGPLVGAVVAMIVRGESITAWIHRRVLRLPSLQWLVVIPLLVVVHEIGRIAVIAVVPPFGLHPVAPIGTNMLVGLPIAILSATMVGGGLEEFGWRGYALPRLQERTTALRASVILGVVWWVWHLPQYVAVPYGVSAFAAFLVATVGLSLLLTWVFNGSGGVIWSAVLLHGVHNGLQSVAGFFAIDRLILYSLAGAFAALLLLTYPLCRYGLGGLARTGKILPGD